MLNRVDLQGCLSRQDVEELPGLGVKVVDFALARWDHLLNDTQSWGGEQSPTITAISPIVVLVWCARYRSIHRSLSFSEHLNMFPRTIVIVHLEGIFNLTSLVAIGLM